MEGSGFGGFPFGGDPEDLLRGLREFAEQQAETVQEAQREQFATLTLNTAVELTAAALKQVQPTGAIDEQAVALRDAMRVLFPRRSRSSRQPARASCKALESRAVSLFDRAVVTLLPAVPKRVVGRLSRATSPARRSRTRWAWSHGLNAEGKLATVDVLGEEVTEASEAEAIAAEYVAALDAFEREGLDANVSVKPTVSA